MRNVNIVLDWRSCKSEGVNTDRFAEAIKLQLREIEYFAEVDTAENPTGDYSPNGINRLGGEELSSEELTRIQKIIEEIFKKMRKE